MVSRSPESRITYTIGMIVLCRKTANFEKDAQTLKSPATIKPLTSHCSARSAWPCLRIHI